MHLKWSAEETVISMILLLPLSLTHIRTHTHTHKSRNHHWTTKLTLPTPLLATHSVTNTSDWERNEEWQNICSIWIWTIRKKEKGKKEGVRTERSHISDKLLRDLLCDVRPGRRVFTAHCVYFTWDWHGAELNWENSGEQGKGENRLLFWQLFIFPAQPKVHLLSVLVNTDQTVSSDLI